jgi:hypothetical protein
LLDHCQIAYTLALEFYTQEKRPRECHKIKHQLEFLRIKFSELSGK